MRRFIVWFLPAAFVAAVAIAWFWTHLPEWGYCIEEGPNQGCDQGVFVSNAVVGTIVLVVALVGLLIAVVSTRGTHRTGILIASTVGFAILLLVAMGLQLASLEAVPMPI